MMKIAVAGATGAIGKVIVEKAREAGHDVVEMSRAQGVELLEGTGIEEALAGVDAVIDASQVGNPMAEDPITPILRGTKNLLDAAQAQNVHRVVMLSINGVEKPQLQEFPFYETRFEQEELVLKANHNNVVVRSVQWFEFALNPAGCEESASEVKVQNWDIQPAAMDSVAQFMVEAAEGKHGEGLLTVAGGDRLSLPELTQRVMDSRGDTRTVVTVDPVLPALGDGSLHAPGNAHILKPTLQQWLNS